MDCLVCDRLTNLANVFLRSPQSHLGNVLVDMKLIDMKDTLPVGFIPIQETVDTRKQAPPPLQVLFKPLRLLTSILNPSFLLTSILDPSSQFTSILNYLCVGVKCAED